MRRIINSPLKFVGLLTALLGVAVTVIFISVTALGPFFIGVGLLVYFIGYLISRLKNKRAFWTAQFVFTTAYLMLAFVSYMNWQEHNQIIFPQGFKGQAGIIFGIEGYPQLPETEYWKKQIYIPDGGIIITSTKVEEIPGTIRMAIGGNSTGNVQIHWEPNFEIDCITCDSKIKSWLFQVDGQQSAIVKDVMIDLCNEIARNEAASFYKSDFSPVSTDNKGKYLWLQDKGLTSLPDGIGKLDIYKVVLSGNNFTELPPQILEIDSLETLILAVNPMRKFPCNLHNLKKLKSISFANTAIKEIICDLSQFNSLVHFDLSANELSKLPEQIKNLPNLAWLSLNGNHFTDLSFVDNRLSNLETLYLYSNKIESISEETRHLSNLKELLIFDNQIDSLPGNISDLKNLVKLEIWNNPIKYISPNIAELTKLKSITIDDDYLTQTDKKHLKKWLPDCKINYQTRSKKKVSGYN